MHARENIQKAHGSSAEPDTMRMAHLHPSIGMATKWAKNTVNPMARGARICKVHEKLAQLFILISVFQHQAFKPA